MNKPLPYLLFQPIGTLRSAFLCLAMWLCLASCGGGEPVKYTPGIYQDASVYAGRCAVPYDELTDIPGSTTLENFWIRSWSHNLYLWYAELPDLDPAQYDTADYFALMKSSAITSSGQYKDRFHFTYPTDEWQALAQSGVSLGYGAEWTIVSGTLPRDVRVAFIEPNSPAASANLSRGIRVLAVDGADLLYGNTSDVIDTLNAGLWPDQAGSHTFLIEELNSAQRTITMTAKSVTSLSVHTTTTLPDGNGGQLGYLLFNDHLATAEQQLIDAITELKQDNINDLVLDLRYNGGGYLAIASELAYMIAGATSTSSHTFELTQFNDQRPSIDPVTGTVITPMPFYSQAQGFSTTSGTILPTLNLSRVFVLTGSGTCSASESVINGLRGVGVEVIQIGGTTCGKPYGFYPQNNCGTTYFSIEFKGVNDQDFGDYPDGFSPANTSSDAGLLLPGCSVADDFTHELSNASESRLAAALYYRQHQSCSSAYTTANHAIRAQSLGAEPGLALQGKGPWRTNRILGSVNNTTDTATR